MGLAIEALARGGVGAKNLGPGMSSVIGKVEIPLGGGEVITRGPRGIPSPPFLLASDSLLPPSP